MIKGSNLCIVSLYIISLYYRDQAKGLFDGEAPEVISGSMAHVFGIIMRAVFKKEIYEDGFLLIRYASMDKKLVKNK